MAPSLTEVQKKILQFIEDEISFAGSPPTLRAIAKHFGFQAIGTVQTHLRALTQKGYLEKDFGKARGIRIRNRAQHHDVPILGQIAAGSPREALEITLGHVPIPSTIMKPGEHFALRVTGDSMIHAGIHDGDIVIARKQSSAADGDIVVALVEGEGTVKRLEKKNGRVRLLPENSQYSPIEIRSTDDVIQGKVISIQRYLEKSIV